MDIQVLKTYEISDSLWKQITEGFNESFGLHKTVEEMKNAFCIKNKEGYGYHALAIAEDGELAGYNVFSPTYYKGGLKAVVSGSTYVRPKYRRNEMLFMNMVQALRRVVSEDGFRVEIGVPNHNSEKFALKVLKFKPVAELNYYILPLNASRILNKRQLRVLDGFIRLCAKVHMLLNSFCYCFYNVKERPAKYELEYDDKYWDYRFGGSEYTTYKEGCFQAHWLLYDENCAKVAYLMDFREKSKRSYRSLFKAVKAILKSRNVDAVLFVGFLHMNQPLLLKIPKRFVPKRLPLTYYVMNKDDKDVFSDMQDKNNWNFSLENFDVR